MARTRRHTKVDGQESGPGGEQEGRAKESSPWIIRGWADLLWFLATPVLIVPVMALTRVRFSIEEISLFVATGHHLQ